MGLGGLNLGMLTVWVDEWEDVEVVVVEEGCGIINVSVAGCKLEGEVFDDLAQC